MVIASSLEKLASVEMIKNDNIKTGSFLFLFLLLYAFVILRVGPEQMLVSDALWKYVQARSLIENQYNSQELFYPARDIDPEYHYHPSSEVFRVRINDKTFGSFPVTLSLVGSLLLQAFRPLGSIPGLNFFSPLSLLFLFWLLHKFWQIPRRWLAASLFLTPFFIYSFDYSELILFAALGLLFITRILPVDLNPGEKKPSKNTKSSVISGIVAGLAIGLAVFFRHEALILFLSAGIAIFIHFFTSHIVPVLKHGWPGYLWKHTFLRASLVAAAFGTSLFALFFLFNYISYGHGFGPRYIANDPDSLSLTDRFNIISGLFFYDYLKFGYFAYTPHYLFIFAGFIPAIYNKLEIQYKIILSTTTLYLFLIAITAPNSGGGSWGGRYLIAAAPLSIILLYRYYRLFRQTMHGSRYRIHKGILLLIICFFSINSLILTYLGSNYADRLSRTVKDHRQAITAVEADIRIFTVSQLADLIGPEYFDSSYLTYRNLDYKTPEQQATEMADRISEQRSGETLAIYEVHGISDSVLRQTVERRADFEYLQNEEVPAIVPVQTYLYRIQ